MCVSVCIFCVLPVCVQGSLYLQVEEDDLGEEDTRAERTRTERQQSPDDDEEEEEADVNSENEEEEEDEAALDSDDQMWRSDNKSDR